ncbi:hypothetical protein NS303_09655 [Pantoea ananatis]|uniref:Uncharacterized protein n=1 Tax=Pantoea ananas TaxID=553 RepID=A0AAJ1CW96_PANAN|nr:hypothetical protein [Pantoea ananatis]KGL51304.1 hypothetical protein KR94_19560 [Pantoea ananatis]KTR48467.1 hypothetical protein NS303_09655 [Pantoea ananatis]KTR55031.1 hypothetical protein NS311_14655 [Pantoea ananatis]KTR64351.1 hypothetical protein RSA47_13495 [Pantoea ananatis]KTR68440.1 hypothetical protein NS296_17845 [Pantoea ananatis]
MTSLLLITLVAFVLLAIIIFMLVRTTRLRVWQGIVLFILPLILSNILLFKWILPQQQQEKRYERAADYMAQATVYRVLRTQEPALWQLLTRELAHKLREGEPMIQAVGELRGWLTDVINQRLMRASNHAIVNYIGVSVEEMQALNKRDPGLCFQFLYPQVKGGVNLAETLPAALNQKEAEATEYLLLNSLTEEQPLDRDQAQNDLKNIVDRLYQKWGDKLQQLNMPADTAVDRSSMCAMSIDLYSAILALPDKQAANLLRRMIALSGEG